MLAKAITGNNVKAHVEWARRTQGPRKAHSHGQRRYLMIGRRPPKQRIEFTSNHRCDGA